MSLLDNFPHKCSILKRTRTTDDFGGSKDARTTVSTDVLCWEQKASVSEVIQFEKRGITDVRKIYFTSDPKVTEQNEIQITERNGVIQTSLQEFEVLSVSGPDASAGLEIVWWVMARNITGANQ